MTVDLYQCLLYTRDFLGADGWSLLTFYVLYQEGLLGANGWYLLTFMLFCTKGGLMVITVDVHIVFYTGAFWGLMVDYC